MPTIHELSSLFDDLPELPPPAPRQRRGPGAPSSTTPANSQQKGVLQKNSTSMTGRIRSCIYAWLKMDSSKSQARPWRPNPFQVLKNGKKIIVVAAVDSGMISFYRFGQGVFEEWPMM